MKSDIDLFVKNVQAIRKLTNLIKLPGFPDYQKNIWRKLARNCGKRAKHHYSKMVKSGMPRNTLKEMSKFV